MLQEPAPQPPPAPSRLVDDPEFAPSALASEKAAVQAYRATVAPEPRTPVGYDARLRPWGYALIAIWIGALTGAAVLRHKKRSASGG